MNKIIISIMIILFIVIYVSKDKILPLIIHIPKTPIENIDTSFFTDIQKQDFIDIGKLGIKNNIYKIEILNNQIQYYDRNILFIDTTLGENIEKKLIDYKVQSLILKKDNKSEGIRINITFLDQKFIYSYFSENQIYTEGDIVFYTYRVEKVIDKNWYIFRLCENRNVCIDL